MAKQALAAAKCLSGRGDLDGWSVLAALRQDPELAELFCAAPIIVCPTFHDRRPVLYAIQRIKGLSDIGSRRMIRSNHNCTTSIGCIGPRSDQPDEPSH
jgi:hypothetical protein